MRIVVAIAAVLLSAGCGAAAQGPVVVDRGGSATPPYDGPLTAHAAVAALECDGETPRRPEQASYDDGLAEVEPSAEAALEGYMRDSFLLFFLPSGGWAVERREAGRVLFSYDATGRTKAAIVVADGIRDYIGDEGWGVRAWAQCDPSEFPPDVTAELNIGVWEDESGRRVPVTRVQSFQGDEHCAWTHITFLLVGPEKTADWYVRDTGDEFSRLLRTTFTDDATLPEGATDTGWRRDGRQLWIAPDEEAAYLVSVDDAQDVERWPAARQPIQCA